MKRQARIDAKAARSTRAELNTLLKSIQDRRAL
jgi:hypothetical protein